MAFIHTPRAPKGHFPQLAVHGYFINKASRNRPAAWEPDGIEPQDVPEFDLRHQVQVL